MTVSLTLTNTGSQTWLKSGANPVYVTYHWYNSSWQVVVWDGMRTALPKDVALGETITMQANLRAPDRSGEYTLRWDMLDTSINKWFSTEDVATLDVAVRVTPFALPIVLTAANIVVPIYLRRHRKRRELICTMSACIHKVKTQIEDLAYGVLDFPVVRDSMTQLCQGGEILYYHNKLSVRDIYKEVLCLDEKLQMLDIKFRWGIQPLAEKVRKGVKRLSEHGATDTFLQEICHIYIWLSDIDDLLGEQHKKQRKVV